jgi:hypothetical protein
MKQLNYKPIGSVLLRLCGVIKSFLILMWKTLSIRSVGVIFNHPDLDSKPKNVL